jgi:hypothetical protein
MNSSLKFIVVVLGSIFTFNAIGYAQVTFTEHTIVNNFNEPWSVFPVDIDGDLDIDIVGSARLGHQIAWWENDGNQNFTINPVSNSSLFAMGVEAADMDGDSDIDIVCASQTNGVELWENQGNQNFTRITIGSWLNASFIYTTDVDSNGYLDVLVACCEGGTNRMGWIENHGNLSFTDHIVASNWDHANSVYAADIDLDGDVDLLGTASGRSTGIGEIAWFENNGSQVFAKHLILSTGARPSCVIALDIDFDLDIDVVASVCQVDQIILFENNGSQGFTQSVIGYGFNRPHSVDTADFDNDGDIDILACAINNDNISWLENDGSLNFTQNIITNNLDGAADVFAADIDQDGDIDFLGTAHYADQIKWWENEGTVDVEKQVLPPFYFQILQNYPNPFNPKTTIEYKIPELSFITLKVYNVVGNEAATLVKKEQPAGNYEIEFNAVALPSGVYFYKLQSGAFVETKKMVVIK